MNAAIPALPSVCPMFPLDRTQQTWLAAARFVDVAQSVGLDHVAQKSAGSVGFDEVDLSGLDLCETERAAHQLDLRPAAWGGDPVAAAIVIGNRTFHHRVNRLAVGNGVVQSAQHHRGHPLTPADAVGALSGTVCSAHPARRAQLGCKKSKAQV